MSFSSEVKEEIGKQIQGGRHCMIAEIFAILSMCGKIKISSNDSYTITVQTENVYVARRFYELLKRAFSINPMITIRRNDYLKKSRQYCILINHNQEASQILKAVKILDAHGNLEEEDNRQFLLQQTCCKRAYIRGVFLAAGSISDPEKNYHFEIVCTKLSKAEEIQEVINFFDLDAKIVKRKKYYVVYLKESSKIVEVLNLMNAPIALLRLENIRIEKEVRNTVNRQVNCETANIQKIVTAASRQIEDIEYIRTHGGFGELTEGLCEIANVRLQYPEISLKELGTMLNPPVGKSGVNHRLRKLSEIAQKMRESTF